MAYPARIAVLPTPGMGHLIPLVEFAKKLYSHHNVATTFIIPGEGPPSTAQNNFLATLPSAIDYILLPYIQLDDLPPETKTEIRIYLTVSRSLPALRNALKSLNESKKISAFVVDLFGTEAIQLGSQLNILTYLFYPTTAMTLCVIYHIPKLDQMVSGEFRDVEEELQIPGCTPIHGRDLMDPVQDRNNDAYKGIFIQLEAMKFIEGIIVNSFKELEPHAFETLQNGKPNIYPIGPLTQKKPINVSVSHPCLKWLDDQPECSVLYVSFGSGGTLSYNQTIELAVGLESSGHKFIWVLRSPNDTSSSANFFGVENSDDPLSYLPDGFIQRIENRGMVIPRWAPQAEILAHKATGGFLTHCGWNSSLESIVNGVAMIAWPLYAEQKMNAVMLHKDVKVALRPVSGENGLVERSEVCKVAKELMEGEEGVKIKMRAREMKKKTEEVLSENGSSTNCLVQLVATWKSINGSSAL